MKRQMKASAVALLVSGCLLALSAGAAGKETAPSPARCTFECNAKANKAMEACTQACPMSKEPNKKEASAKCLSKCNDKRTASLSSCTGSCPKEPPPPKTEGTPKTPAPTKAP